MKSNVGQTPTKKNSKSYTKLGSMLIVEQFHPWETVSTGLKSFMGEAAYYNTSFDNADQTDGRLLAFLKKTIASLHPAYFGVVMATGIVSIDCQLFGLSAPARGLFTANLIIYFMLACLYLFRAAFFRKEFFSDWFSHKRAFGFFTMIAGTNVLGTQFVLIAGDKSLASCLWWTGITLWIAFTYSIFVFLIVQEDKPSIEQGINGGWLLAVVATQSICVLGCQIQPLIFSSEFTVFLLLSFWLFGGMLYIWLISLIFYRYMFFRFQASDLIPPYWINMGAMAITTLAGAELLRVYGQSPLLSEMTPFLKGLSAMYWATATWWIPMLLMLGLWRHGIKGFKFTYDPLYWGLVFPLGMYSVCTLKLAAVFQIDSLSKISQLFLFLGLIAWCLTFLSMAQRPLYVLVLLLRNRKTRIKHIHLEETKDGCQ